MKRSFIEQRLTQFAHMERKTLFKTVERLPEFKKDLKRLLKKFRTLDEDLEVFIKTQLVGFHKLGLDNGGIFQITDLGIASPKIFKAKKFACKALKGRGVMSGIRLIYAYDEVADAVNLIEMYFKSEKASEDRGRIREHYR